VFWLPLRATDAGGNTRMCLSAPFVFVDNELSLLSGREDFGYAKSLAEFCPRNGSGPNVTVRAFGGNFGLNSKADWREVLHIAEVGAVLGTAWGTPQNIAAELVRSAGAAKANLTLFLQKLVEELVEEKARHVFLKQFRDAEIAGKACLRCVVESPVAFTEPSVRLLLGAWEVAVTPLDSQPITTDLGVQTQITPLAFELKMNMLLNPGDVVAP
jgi:hypothetical protein